MERTLVMYHGGCPDGFGGAYAAWKKFGDSVEYIPLHRGDDAPDVTGAQVYLIDFTYTREVMDKLLSQAASLVVLDHHEGVADVTTAMPDHVYDAKRSGATIAWNYFHSDTPTPYFLKLLQDQDNYEMQLEDTVPVHAYLEVHPYDFVEWDAICSTLEDPEKRDVFLNKARAYAEYFVLLGDIAVRKAKLVSFEGYETYFATTHPVKSLKSRVGHLLTEKKGPIALVVTAHPLGYGVSIRGDGSVDVSKIAAKYGGNGHVSSSGFLIPREGPFPWQPIEDHEDSLN